MSKILQRLFLARFQPHIQPSVVSSLFKFQSSPVCLSAPTLNWNFPTCVTQHGCNTV